MDGGMEEVVECQPHKHEAPSSNPSITKNKGKGKRKKMASTLENE
jgi:hypothetical protein